MMLHVELNFEIRFTKRDLKREFKEYFLINKLDFFKNKLFL